MSISVLLNGTPHVDTNFKNDSNGSKVSAGTRSGLENGKLLLIGNGESKN